MWISVESREHQADGWVHPVLHHIIHHAPKPRRIGPPPCCGKTGGRTSSIGRPPHTHTRAHALPPPAVHCRPHCSCTSVLSSNAHCARATPWVRLVRVPCTRATVRGVGGAWWWAERAQRRKPRGIGAALAITPPGWYAPSSPKETDAQGGGSSSRQRPLVGTGTRRGGCGPVPGSFPSTATSRLASSTAAVSTGRPIPLVACPFGRSSWRVFPITRKAWQGEGV